MKMTIESTAELVDINGVPARIWQGESDSGTPVIAFVTRIAVPEDAGEQAHAQFAAELQQHAVPRAAVQTLPTRMLID